MPIKERIGTVISNKMQKTVVIAVKNNYKSTLYSKIKVRTKKYLVHDPSNVCKIGDQVIVKESRPLSRKKRWLLKKVLKK